MTAYRTPIDKMTVKKIIEIRVDKMIADWMSIDKIAVAKMAFNHVMVYEMYLDRMTESKLSVDKMIVYRCL
jgi:hypothetical protein